MKQQAVDPSVQRLGQRCEGLPSGLVVCEGLQLVRAGVEEALPRVSHRLRRLARRGLGGVAEERRHADLLAGVGCVRFGGG